MSERIYGTWVDSKTGIRHFASGVERDGCWPKHRHGEWDTNLSCGRYIDDKPFVASTDDIMVVTCIRCIYRWLRPRSQHDILRGLTADQVIIDEVADVDAQVLANVERAINATLSGS